MEKCKPKFLPLHLGPLSYKNGNFTFKRPDTLSPTPSFFPTILKSATSIKTFARIKTFEVISASSIIYSINNKEFHIRDIDSKKSYSFKVNEEVKSVISTSSVIYLISRNYLYTANQKVLKCIHISNIIDFDFSEITSELFILTDTCIIIYGEKKRSTYAHYLPNPFFIRILQHPRLVVVSLYRHIVLVDLRSSTIKQNPLFKLRNLDSSIQEYIKSRDTSKGEKNKENDGNFINDLSRDTVTKNKSKQSDIENTKKIKLPAAELSLEKNKNRDKTVRRPNYDFDKKIPIYSNLTVLTVINEDISKITKFKNGLYIFCYKRMYKMPDIRTGITFYDEIGVFLKNCNMYIGERDLVVYNKKCVFQYISHNNLFDTRFCLYDIDGFSDFSLQKNIYGFLFKDQCIMFEEKNINDYKKNVIYLKPGSKLSSNSVKTPRFEIDYVVPHRNYQIMYDDDLSCEYLDEIESMIKEIKGSKKEENVKTQEQPLLDIFYDAQSDTCGF